MIKNNICNNCGKQGHMFHQCKLPITSYGIILFRSSDIGIQYLMIRRKDSFGYIDFIRGKYVYNNMEQLYNIFNQMSTLELQRILNNDFDTLWEMMWGVSMSNQFKCEESISRKKFEALKNGVMSDNNEIITLSLLVTNVTTQWNETEWEFPKGRRNYHEKDITCAIREFEEETGMLKTDIIIVENVLPFEEIFLGSNHKSYKHKYFLAYTEKIVDALQNFQQTEVSKLEWKTFNECLDSIRPYHLEKKQLIININTILQEYVLYS
jgi:8-oxo-dGTP pyrophosphatase MutT (NUDIX family)